MGDVPHDDDPAGLAGARDELLLLDLGMRRPIAAALGCVDTLARSPDPLDLRYLVPLVFAEQWKVRSKPEALGEVADAAERAALAVLTRVPPEACLAIDVAMRRPGYRFLGWRYFREWAGLGPDELLAALGARAEPPAPLLGILSTHPSGFVREIAVRALDRCGPEALRWMLLRSNDWAPPVQRLAIDATLRRIVPENAGELVECLPLLDRLRAQRRADHGALFAAVDALFAKDDAPLRERGLANPRATVRRQAFRAAEVAHGPSFDLLARALSDQDPAIRLWAARRAEALAPLERARLAPLLLATRAGAVRRIGLRLASEASLAGIEALLCRGVDDASAASRHLARFLLRERGATENFAEHYRRALRCGRASLGALGGLAELGRPSDWELFVPYADARGARARVAVKAMARLDRAASHELRMVLLGSSDRGVSGEAARTLAGSIGPDDADVLAEYLASEHAHVRRRALGLSVYLPGWQAPITLLAHERPSERDARDEALRRWLARAWKGVCAPGADEAERLASLLDRAELAESVRDSMTRLLRFVAGDLVGEGTGDTPEPSPASL